MNQTNTLVKAQKITSFKRSLAVVIGINQYQNKIPKLQTARRDAEVLAQILAKEHQYDEVILITDETECKPTLKNLLTLLEERLPKEIQPTKDDRLLFYFAGHGIARDSDKGPAGYLVPQDADLEKNENLLPMQKLHECLTALSCRHLLVILDCCFAGTFRWSTARLATVIPTVIRKEHYDRFIKSPAWQAITSAAHNQEALDILRDNRGGINHSPFALALFKALRGEGDVIPAAKNGKSAGDGVISATELYLYLRDHVETASNESQTPGIWTLSKHDRGEYIFLVPGADPKLKPAPKLNEKNNPYRGLQSFEEEHSQLFFGRKELVDELYEKVSHTSSLLTVVLGNSGFGKSSLVKAGLIPYLHQNHSQEWYILKPMRPSESPFTALARTILLITNNNEIVVSKQLDDLHFLDEILQQEITALNQRIDDGDINSESDEITRLEQKVKKSEIIADIWKRGTKEAKQFLIVAHFDELNNLCHDKNEQKLLQEAVLNCLNPLSQRLQDPNEFIKIVKTWSEQRPGIRLLLVIDQFEELITLSSHSEEDKQNKQANLTESQQFLKLLEATLAANLPQLSIVVTLRSDFEPRFLNSEALKSYWTHARFSVRAMRSDELRSAIERPAAEMALYFEQLPGERNPIDKLVDEVGQMPGALPLLSFTLSELYIKLAKKWEAGESSDRALTLDAEFDKEGGIAGSLTRRANKEYDELPESTKGTMRRVMLRMVTTEGGVLARRRVPNSELVYLDDAENQRREQIINRLVTARLIVVGQETGGEAYVEPAHDYLVQGWAKLQNWIKEDSDNLALQQRLTPAADDWKEDKGSLWTEEEGRLSRLKLAIKSGRNWLNKVETEFINKSIETRRKRFEENEKQRDEALQGQISALAALSEARFQDDQLGALIHILKAARILQQLRNSESQWIQEDTRLRTEVVLRQILSKVKEFNRLEDKDIPLSMVAELSFTSNRAILLLDNQGRLLKLEFTTDQQLILMRDSQRIIRFWQSDGTLVERIPPGFSPVKLSSDGQMIAHFIHRTSQPQQEPKANAIRLMNLEGKQVILQNDERDNLMIFAFSPNGQLIASGGWFGELYLWKTDGTTIQQKQTGGNSLNAIDFSPNGDMFATGSNDGKIRFWDQNGEFLTTIEAHRDAIWGVSFSPDGETLASVSTDTTVKIWKTDGTLVITLNGHKDKVGAVCLNSDGQILASASNDGNVRLWRPNGTKLKGLDDHHTGSVYAVRFNPKQPMIATTSGQGQLILWSQDGRLLRTWEKGHNGTITALDFSPNGRMFVTAAGDREVKLWRLDDDDKDKQDFRPHNLGNHTGESHLQTVFGVSFSSDNQTILLGSGSQDGKGYLELCDSESKLCRIIVEYDYQVLAVCFSPDGQMFALGKGDGSVELWRKEEDNFKLLRNFKQHDNLVLVVCFSPDGNFLATGSADKTVKLWQIDNILNNTNSTTVTPTKIFAHTDQVTAVRFSPNGEFIATASYDKTVKLWNLDGTLNKTLHGHNDQVNALDFSPDGKILASASNDKTAILWNLELELGLDQLIDYGCDWISGYLTNNPNVSESDRKVLFAEKFSTLKYDSQKWI